MPAVSQLLSLIGHLFPERTYQTHYVQMMFSLAPLPVILQIASVLFSQNTQQKLMLSEPPAKPSESIAIPISFKPSANVEKF